MLGTRITYESTRQLRECVERHRLVNALHEHLVDGNLSRATRERYLLQLESIVAAAAEALGASG